MERCPYCGAAVRVGARFCTSCGRRLNESNGETLVATAPAPSEAGNGADEAVAWESVSTSVDHSGERAAPAADDWLRRTPVASADLWPASTRSQEAPTGAEAPGPSAEAAPAVAEEPVVPAWSASPWASWAMPPAVEEERTGEVDLVVETETVATVDADRELAAEVAETPTVEPAAEPLAPTKAAAPEPVLPSEVAAVGAVSDPGAGGALARAVSLVDELRSLLPAVAGLDGIDVAGAVAALGAAREQAAELSDEELSRLATSVEVARARPREIDALLGLAGNLDGLAAVVAAHGQLRAGIDQAVALLGGAPRAAYEDGVFDSDDGE
jgi:hypothetical protein